MDEDDVPAAAIAAAAAAARALMRAGAAAGDDAAVVEAAAASALALARRFCGQGWAGWDETPAPVRHGVAMLAQHLFEQRGGSALPPAAVAALWRPYRVARLA